jgi:hypothetical protein
MCRNSPGGSALLEPISSPATTSWTWRPPPMFASALTSRLTPLRRSACSTRSRPPCQSPGRRSRRRNGRHPRLPGLPRLRCRSPAPVPSTARLISRPDAAVLGLRVAAGGPALDELAGETAVPSLPESDGLGQPDDTATSGRSTTRADSRRSVSRDGHLCCSKWISRPPVAVSSVSDSTLILHAPTRDPAG